MDVWLLILLLFIIGIFATHNVSSSSTTLKGGLPANDLMCYLDGGGVVLNDFSPAQSLQGRLITVKRILNAPFVNPFASVGQIIITDTENGSDIGTAPLQFTGTGNVGTFTFPTLSLSGIYFVRVTVQMYSNASDMQNQVNLSESYTVSPNDLFKIVSNGP